MSLEFNQCILIPDLIENILSDYIEYDQLLELKDEIKILKINPNRIQIKEYIDEYKNKIKETYIDTELRIKESWYLNGKKWYILNLKNGLGEGIKNTWYDNGNQEYMLNYKNGKFEGAQKAWYKNGEQCFIKNYKNGELIY